MFNPSILELESQIQYHQEQQELAEQELDRLKMTQAFAEDAAEKVEEALEHIDPKYIDVFKEHLLSLFPPERDEGAFPVETPHYLEEQETNDYVEKINSHPIPTKVKEEKEFGQLSYYELTGRPDTRPDTYEDLVPNIAYSSSGRAYVGFNDRTKAEGFRDHLEIPSMLDEAKIMNIHKYEVKFYCDRSYIEELLGVSHQLHNDDFEQDEDWSEEQKAELDWQEQLVRIAPDIFYDPAGGKCFMGFSAKGRADQYGSYLSRILDIAEKYIVTNKPRVTTNTKYELVLEQIELKSVQHLSKFNLKKEYDDSKNKDARELWRTTRKRVHPPAYKPSPKLVPLEEIKLGDIVYLNSIDNQYKVLQKVELDGIPHIEVICVYNSERPSLVSAISYLKECYLVPTENIQIDSQFQSPEKPEVKKSEGLTADDFPSPPYKLIPLSEVELADIVTTSPNSQSAYEVTANLGDHLLATCLYNKSLKHREGQKDFWITEAYLVQKGDMTASKVTDIPVAS